MTSQSSQSSQRELRKAFQGLKIGSIKYKSEHHLLTILENAPYTSKGWMVAIDRWNHRELPTFFKTIPFWVRIENLPNIYKREEIVKCIGSKLGHVEEVEITEPTGIRPAEVGLSFDVCPHPHNLETQSFQLMQIDPALVTMESSALALPSLSEQTSGPQSAAPTTVSASSFQALPNTSLLKIDSTDPGEPSSRMELGSKRKQQDSEAHQHPLTTKHQS
ncbi:unnamed protein product [Thlaspi arvense]|uniref:DUF4283 domain-containing protein n=1 Tax=Thlaspi arvense TaxID=13288 RepID=A0AAU9RUP4_THLAR|nr:unnamed protein product [Thlaspi arvense]